MDTRTFDALTRRFGAQRNRRAALKAFAGGLVGLVIGRDTSAQVGVEKQTCNQRCNSDGDCNAGLRCSRPSGSNGRCVRIADSEDTCTSNSECDRNFERCDNNRRRCVNDTYPDCSACNIDSDCPSGRVCRNNRCGDCTRDRQCPGREVCRNGRCERGRNDCNRNRDCPRGRRCRNGRCVRRD
jgi:Cys-rich repeat protein